MNNNVQKKARLVKKALGNSGYSYVILPTADDFGKVSRATGTSYVISRAENRYKDGVSGTTWRGLAVYDDEGMPMRLFSLTGDKDVKLLKSTSKFYQDIELINEIKDLLADVGFNVASDTVTSETSPITAKEQLKSVTNALQKIEAFLHKTHGYEPVLTALSTATAQAQAVIEEIAPRGNKERKQTAQVVIEEPQNDKKTVSGSTKRGQEAAQVVQSAKIVRTLPQPKHDDLDDLPTESNAAVMDSDYAYTLVQGIFYNDKGKAKLVQHQQLAAALSATPNQYTKEVKAYFKRCGYDDFTIELFGVSEEYEDTYELIITAIEDDSTALVECTKNGQFFEFTPID